MKVSVAHIGRFTQQHVYPSKCLIMKTKKGRKTQYIDKHVFVL